MLCYSVGVYLVGDALVSELVGEDFSSNSLPLKKTDFSPSFLTSKSSFPVPPYEALAKLIARGAFLQPHAIQELRVQERFFDKVSFRRMNEWGIGGREGADAGAGQEVSAAECDP